MSANAQSRPEPIPVPGASHAPTSPTSVPSDIATSPNARRKSNPSPPIDPSRLNNHPAPLPEQPESPKAEPRSPPLRSPQNSISSHSVTAADSAYLDTGLPAEPASHPTVAETGALSSSHETGPRQGQLKRVEKKGDGGIIKLGSLGGDGLKIKPPVDRED
ncbi:hypothetical protein C366_03291 [Cryptococcus neoformans Tu401-1]|nr:hypothetical protein C365_03450 [Cryptococcus neoformans var. grubii Bt85]OXG17207.1 hypothetical protein C366_03291 [Cryptococcus neoformans var. grubii Tu401-1]OXM78784.1 hypothetical protein C364_03256 [Cryptococcus neoformans var. grubii Bt63]